MQRTSGLADTLKKYGYLTQAITQYYKAIVMDDHYKCSGTCPRFGEFIKRCQDIDKMTVSDVFAVQLMQVLVYAKLRGHCVSLWCQTLNL